MSSFIKIVYRVDILKLQLVLPALCNWAAEWQFGISVDTCCVVTFGKGEIIDQFNIRDTPLPVVSACRDISNDLSPIAHINDIVFKTHQRANLILC